MPKSDAYLKTNFERQLTEIKEFNAQEAYLYQLLRRWDELDKVSVMNDQATWYRLLRTFWINIRIRIKQKVYKKNPNQFKELEKKIESAFLVTQNMIFTKSNKELDNQTMNQAEKNLRKIQEKMIELLFLSGMIFPNFVFGTWEEEERRNFL